MLIVTCLVATLVSALHVCGSNSLLGSRAVMIVGINVGVTVIVAMLMTLHVGAGMIVITRMVMYMIGIARIKQQGTLTIASLMPVYIHTHINPLHVYQQRRKAREEVEVSGEFVQRQQCVLDRSSLPPSFTVTATSSVGHIAAAMPTTLTTRRGHSITIITPVQHPLPRDAAARAHSIAHAHIAVDTSPIIVTRATHITTMFVIPSTAHIAHVLYTHTLSPFPSLLTSTPAWIRSE